MAPFTLFLLRLHLHYLKPFPLVRERSDDTEVVRRRFCPFEAMTKIMKHSLFIIGLLATTAVSAHAQKAEDSHQVQAGTRIGRVFIGDTKGAVGRRLGKPTGTFTLGSGLTSQLWRGKTAGDLGTRNTLEVVFRGGIVSQIEATSLVFQTAGGLSLSSRRSRWENTYGTPTVSTYTYGSGQRKRYLDWKSKGIAIELVRGDEQGADWTYQTLIVHKKAIPVVVDRGGTRE